MDKKNIGVIVAALLIIAGVITGALLSGSANAAPLPAVTTVPSAYTVPGTGLAVAPQQQSALAARTADADSKVKAICANPQAGVGCFNSTPASIQYVLFSDHHDPSSLLTNEPVYLLQWHLTGKDCLLGHGGPINHPNESQIAANASCTYSVAVDAGNVMPGQQIDSWAY